jgi:hypothetical protein
MQKKYARKKTVPWLIMDELLQVIKFSRTHQEPNKNSAEPIKIQAKKFTF